MQVLEKGLFSECAEQLPSLRGETFISLANASLSKSFSRYSFRFSISYLTRSNSPQSSSTPHSSSCIPPSGTRDADRQ